MIIIDSSFTYEYHDELLQIIANAVVLNPEVQELVIEKDDDLDRIYIKLNGEPHTIFTDECIRLSESEFMIPIHLYRGVIEERDQDKWSLSTDATIEVEGSNEPSHDMSWNRFNGDEFFGLIDACERGDATKEDFRAFLYHMDDFVVENGMLIRYDGTEKDVVIPEGVAIIGSYAFKGCTNLNSITIPATVGLIDYQAFADCTGLKKVIVCKYCKSSEDEEDIDGEEFGDEGNCGVIHISDNAFYGCTNLFEIVFPNMVEYIDYGAFANSGLKSISFLNEAINIDEDAFEGCNDLTIKAPSGSYAEEYAKENNIPFEAID